MGSSISVQDSMVLISSKPLALEKIQTTIPNSTCVLLMVKSTLGRCILHRRPVIFKITILLGYRVSITIEWSQCTYFLIKIDQISGNCLKKSSEIDRKSTSHFGGSFFGPNHTSTRTWTSKKDKVDFRRFHSDSNKWQ